MVYASGSEALDAAEASELLTQLCVLGEVPHSGMGKAKRARAWSQIAELSAQVSEIASGLARALAPEDGGGAGSR